MIGISSSCLWTCTLVYLKSNLECSPARSLMKPNQSCSYSMATCTPPPSSYNSNILFWGLEAIFVRPSIKLEKFFCITRIPMITFPYTLWILERPNMTTRLAYGSQQMKWLKGNYKASSCERLEWRQRYKNWMASLGNWSPHWQTFLGYLWLVIPLL